MDHHKTQWKDDESRLLYNVFCSPAGGVRIRQTSMDDPSDDVSVALTYAEFENLAAWFGRHARKALAAPEPDTTLQNELDTAREDLERLYRRLDQTADHRAHAADLTRQLDEAREELARLQRRVVAHLAENSFESEPFLRQSVRVLTGVEL